MIHDHDIRIQRAAANLDRSTIGMLTSGAIALSQLILQGKATDTDPYASEAEQLGASMAEGIVTVLTAPLLYASGACVALFLALNLIYHNRLSTLTRQRAQMMQPPQAPGFGQPPYPPPTN